MMTRDQRIAQLELFCWGAFTAITIGGADGILGLEAPIGYKIAAGCVVLFFWFLYVKGGTEEGNSPSLPEQD